MAFAVVFSLLHIHFVQQIPLPNTLGEIYECISKCDPGHALHLSLDVESTCKALSSLALNFQVAKSILLCSS
jgi:hypothetical protein